MKCLLEACVLLSLLLMCSSVSANNISGSDFLCDTTLYNGRPEAKTVNELKPTDIRVIGAMGDSWTSGFRILTAVENLATEFIDFRGLVWSIGGDGSLSTVTTLPNIIRKYNADLYGFSRNTTPALPAGQSLDQFNVGFLGARVTNLTAQAQALVQRIRDDPLVDFEEDWKVVTIFAGFNDLCDYPCVNDPLGDPDVWIQNYTTALDYLRDNLPRTFVNVIQLADLFALHESVATHSTAGPLCRLGLQTICRCSRYGANFTSEENFRNANNAYKMKLAELISSNRYNSRDDFTVELQLFLDKFDLNSFTGGNNDPDLSLLASDCLHLSGRGNRLLAVALWNSMFQPSKDKQETIIDNGPIFCPSEELAVFATSKNLNAAGLSGDCGLHSHVHYVVSFIIVTFLWLWVM